jgi:protein-disulfide isomerase
VERPDRRLCGRSRGFRRNQWLARVAVIEYSDFECPFCGKFARETLPALEAKYVRTGKVLLVFRQFPLPIHALAYKAAEGTLCAGRQDRFWEMHDQLFLNRALDEGSLRRYARVIGLNEQQFESCLQGEAADAVRQEVESGKTLGVSGTPTFLLGYIQPDGRLKVTERLSGAQPVAAFEAVLDRLLRSVPQG